MAKGSGPAVARNCGARAARGEFIAFIDADVVVRPTTLRQLSDCLHSGCDATFGSYDLQPAAANLVSQFKNLSHHFVHQAAKRDASTFWAGCGAIRSDVFARLHGFCEDYRRPCIEDIELGVRMKRAGYQIRLSPDIQVTHLKRWTLASCIAADFFDRALPWTQLILDSKNMPDDLNLKHSQRLCGLLCCCLGILFLVGIWQVPSLALVPPWVLAVLLFTDWAGIKLCPNKGLKLAGETRQAGLSKPGSVSLAIVHQVGATVLLATAGLVAWQHPLWSLLCGMLLLCVIALNARLFTFFYRTCGLSFTLLALPLQVLVYSYSSAAFAWGCARRALRQLWPITAGREANGFGAASSSVQTIETRAKEATRS